MDAFVDGVADTAEQHDAWASCTGEREMAPKSQVFLVYDSSTGDFTCSERLAPT
jgi:hypothetical protein